MTEVSNRRLTVIDDLTDTGQSKKLLDCKAKYTLRKVFLYSLGLKVDQCFKLSSQKYKNHSRGMLTRTSSYILKTLSLSL